MIVKRLYVPPTRYRYGGTSQPSHRIQYRYGGSGIFSNLLGRKLSGDTVKNLINTMSKSKIAQKTANAVLTGASEAVKNQTQKGIEDLAASAINGLKTKHKAYKTKKQYQDIVNSVVQRLNAIPDIPTTSSIEGIVSGKGIIYD